MTREPHKDRTPHKASRHEGAEHGWSPDVDETRQQDNPSAHRSFHPDQYAPDKGTGRTVSKEEAGNPHGRPAKTSGRRGEEVAAKGDDGLHDKGPKGRSQRPSGGKDAGAFTGIRPQDHETDGPAGR